VAPFPAFEERAGLALPRLGQRALSCKGGFP
jgi:hypothetical protein